MATRCTICNRRDRAQIDSALSRGESQHGLSTRLQLSRSALRRHMKTHTQLALPEPGILESGPSLAPLPGEVLTGREPKGISAVCPQAPPPPVELDVTSSPSCSPAVRQARLEQELAECERAIADADAALPRHQAALTRAIVLGDITAVTRARQAVADLQQRRMGLLQQREELLLALPLVRQAVQEAGEHRRQQEQQHWRHVASRSELREAEAYVASLLAGGGGGWWSQDVNPPTPEDRQAIAAQLLQRYPFVEEA
jgi:hypothetical protein